MDVYLVRHGESLSNIGESREFDSMLSPKGEQQAECLGRYLANVRFDKIYSSHMCRAVQTAAAVARHQEGNPEIIIVPEFFETETPGDFEANTELLRSVYPKLNITKTSMGNGCGADIERLEYAVDKYINLPGYSNATETVVTDGKQKRYNPEKILIVSHAGAICYMLSSLVNFRYDINVNIVQHNTCINKFELFLINDVPRKRFLRYNDVPHLPQELRLESQF